LKWPNDTNWKALMNETVAVGGNNYRLSTIECGHLKVPSGQLVCCDPFVAMDKTGNAYIDIPIGEFRVVVTLADVSTNLDGSHIREAYASLIIDDSAMETKRVCLEPTRDGVLSNDKLEGDEFFGFGVDAGTACFVDSASLLEGMPPADVWYEELFENDNADCWFNLMDDPNLIRDGIANIKLPLSKNKNNLILFHSGWGDGFYPVIGGFDDSDKLVAIHIDFFVVSGNDE
jgi:hypothetical protein